MAGAPLRPLLLLYLALAAVADLVVYEDQAQYSVPGVESHTWTLVGDGEDEASGFMMQVETVSATGGNGAATLDGFGSGDTYAWVAQHFGKLQSFPFFVSTFPEDSQGQMLQNVACARFDSALTDVRSQYDASTMWSHSADASTSQDQGWNIEVVFLPHDYDAEGADQDWPDEQSQTSQWRSQSAAGEMGKYSWASAKQQQPTTAPTAGHMLSRGLFFMLLAACALTLFFCVKQACALRCTMKETAQKASGVAFYAGMEEDKPLLQKKGFNLCDDEYMDAMISPIPEPAVKAVYA